MNQERRELTAFDIGCVVVGGIIGVGIFFTPAKVARAVDSPAQVMLAWALGGLLAVLGGLVFAELSTLVPGHGGTFRYIQAAFGRLPAFLYGWANWLVIQAGALGVIALILVDYLEVVLFGEHRLHADVKVAIGGAAILVFTVTNVFGLRVGKRVQNALIVLKVLAIALLVVMSWFSASAAPVAASVPASGRSLPSMLAAAMLPVLFAVGGWQQGSFLAGAAARPRRDVPLGLLGGVAVVVVTYLTINLAFLDALGFAGARASQAIGADAATAILGDVGGRVLAGMVVLSAAGIMNTICLAPPYVLYAMAQQGVFPAAFGRLHPGLHTPILGVLGQGLWALVLMLSVHVGARLSGSGTTDTLGFVCDSVVFVDWLFFMLCGLAVLKLRRTAAPGSWFRVPGGAVAAVLFALAALLVTIGALVESPMPSLVGGLICAAGGLVFAIWRGRTGNRGEPAP